MGLQRFVVYGLRHNPKELGVELDKEGYCPVDALLGSLGITRDRLMEIIRQSGNRLALSADGTRIRAAHGHSVNVDMKMGDVPPDILYHGTSEEASHSISKNGIHRMGRSYVHLSEDIETACRVGGRHSNDIVVFEVDAKAMSKDGIGFHRSEDGVWLTEKVDPKYLIDEEGK